MTGQSQGAESCQEDSSGRDTQSRLAQSPAGSDEEFRISALSDLSVHNYLEEAGMPKISDYVHQAKGHLPGYPECPPSVQESIPVPVSEP